MNSLANATIISFGLIVFIIFMGKGIEDYQIKKYWEERHNTVFERVETCNTIDDNNTLDTTYDFVWCGSDEIPIACKDETKKCLVNN